MISVLILKKIKTFSSRYAIQYEFQAFKNIDFQENCYSL